MHGNPVGRTSRSFFVLLLGFGTLFGLLLDSVRPASAATPEQVDNALKRAKEFLYQKQQNGNWEEVPQRLPNNTPAPTKENPDAKAPGQRTHQWGGLTALATYALLAGGESPQDTRIQQAVQFLKDSEIIGIYALGLRANVWNLLPKTDEIKQAIRKDANLLLLAQHKQGPAKGLFHYYNTGPKGTRIDHSVSQYGVLGMWACSETIEGIPDQFWIDADKAWRANQTKEGSWYYGKGPSKEEDKPRASMTAAGIATLFITQDFLFRSRGVECTGNIVDRNIDAGLKWITGNYDTVYKSQTHYTLYGIERIGVASGYKYFGDINWFEDGASHLVKTQRSDGSWGSVVNTSFGILFLSRGRAPVMMNKLDYETTAQRKGKINWNQRPRDVANIARWVGKQSERDLNWQIVNLNADVAELHDAPILYISGNQALELGKEEKAKIKQFIEQGGMVLANADCNHAGFARSVRELGKELFPDYEFRPLPANHVIYTNQQFPAAKWKKKPELLGMDNGVRELILLVPGGDPARAWQIMAVGSNEELFQMAADIFLYAVDKRDLRYKGETYIIQPDPKIKPTISLKVARVKYNGNWDPEPGGWRRLAALMHNTDRIAVTAEPVELGKGSVKNYKVAHLTGTQALKLDIAQRTELKEFVQEGGTLLIDAAGGKTEFAATIESALGEMFPEEAREAADPVPSSHPIYSAGGKPLEEIGYRSFARTSTVGSSRAPRLRVVEVKGRPGVIFSAEDLSAGMVGQPVDGIIGYDPRTATGLMRNILLVASGHKPGTAR